MASRASLVKCVASSCSRAASRRSVPVVNRLGTIRNSSSAPSSRFFRLRGALVGLQSQQPLHSTIANSLFVSRLSFGTYDVLFLRAGEKPA
ncbi:hypothetical protein KP509_09G062800 [Ceratopteris richardii]|uniref:Uncharacterized protein n=1 Tax=Ceratopteris richardii TaxID=49495 RepID=A0A8T2U1W5_CERRI|nr:hypothetical protein KP509_09G062800 [Ceratopteris richardii]